MKWDENKSHFLITMSVILVYAFTLLKGDADETLQMLLTVIIGYWFGAVGVKKGG